jgi:hypothetical protein
MISKESYIQEFEFQLNEWGLKIEALQSLYENAENNQKKRLNGDIDNLRENYETVKSRLNKIRFADDHEWKDTLENTNECWHDLKISYLSTLLKFK